MKKPAKKNYLWAIEFKKNGLWKLAYFGWSTKAYADQTKFKYKREEPSTEFRVTKYEAAR